ncbi:hypothetical protein EVAR_31982_1 [Eumeta japonica]|uniref:Calcineurin-like phosphoesterase domain-containing protein n=1 Tax=Eumeta variegata TaxID=151549 RepID=A0A4C1VV10_EUMVA|nr:hypothetical protein EVAR_31982_1 [Eumeta japonica]
MTMSGTDGLTWSLRHGASTTPNLVSVTVQQHNAERLLKLIEGVYRWLPLGTIINNRVFVVHGGISDTTDLDMIKSLDRDKPTALSAIYDVACSIDHVPDITRFNFRSQIPKQKIYSNQSCRRTSTAGNGLRCCGGVDTTLIKRAYVSLLRPPVSDGSVPGAEVIDKVEWKQVCDFYFSKFRYENTEKAFSGVGKTLVTPWRTSVDDSDHLISGGSLASFIAYVYNQTYRLRHRDPPRWSSAGGVVIDRCNRRNDRARNRRLNALSGGTGKPFENVEMPKHRHPLNSPDTAAMLPPHIVTGLQGLRRTLSIDVETPFVQEVRASFRYKLEYEFDAYEIQIRWE